MNHNGKLTLDEQLCFALYAATNAIVRAYRPLLKRIGLTYPQYLVMLVLWQDGPSSIGHIAQRLNLANHAITPLLDRLAANGLVQRQRDARDRRIVQVVPTAEGAALESKAWQAQRHIVCQTDLDPEEFARIRAELTTLTNRLETANASTGEKSADALD